jgi:LysM repeat protein
MSSRSPVRWLAPLALVVAILAIVITAGAGGGSSNSNGTTTTARVRSPSATGHPTRTKPPRTYTVKPGDVLSAIAVKTGVRLSQIERLNPNIDAQSLHAGQRLRLEP